jgi:(p)ppGpp synthase/HD superfamily hydrolase
MEHLVNKSLDIARKAHAGKFRRDGVTEYIVHPIDVANRVKKFGLEYVCVAYLHDVLEDTLLMSYDLIDQGIPKHIVEAVKILTKEKGMNYAGYYFDEYLYNVRNNELARRVKIADMISNLADNPTDKQIRKYGEGLVYLTE